MTHQEYGWFSPFALLAAAALVLLMSATRAQGASAAIEGTAWLVEDIAGQGVIDRAQSTISFDTSGRVSGSAGCNRYTGVATIESEALRFGSLATTKRACVPALMDQEQKFLSAMEGVRGYSADANGLLQLKGANGEPLLRLAPMPREALDRSGPASPGAGAAPPPSRTVVFVCDEGEFFVRMSPGQVELVLSDRTLVLPQVPAASGAKYQEGRTVFWNKGNEARFEIDGKVYPDCIRRPG
jgi:heat shock protein HslJ/membrane-bound inhibitor of C-type lysozyme